MAKVQIDIDAEMTLGEFLDMCEEYDLDFKVIETRGPSAGNPVIEFTGDDNDIRRFTADNDYQDEEEY